MTTPTTKKQTRSGAASVKVDDQVLVYGYAKEIRTEPVDWYSFFNGVRMQVMEVDEKYSCSTLFVRHFDLNEHTIRDYFVHANQVRQP